MSDSDPKNRAQSGGNGGDGVNRRDFLKIAGLASAAAGGAGLGAFGYTAGQDPKTYLGWQNQEGASVLFDRKKYEVDEPTYLKIGPTSRPDARVMQIFERRGRFGREYRRIQGGQGVGGFPGTGGPPGGGVPSSDAPRSGPVTAEDFSEPLRSHYRERPEDLELDIRNVDEIQPLMRADNEIYGDAYTLAEAFSLGMGAVGPGPIRGTPEENDFPRDRRGGPAQPMKMKDPVKTAALIKKMAHEFGSTLVGITKLNPDWVYGYPISGRGWENTEVPLEIPEWWEYAIVVGTPMSWDPMFANPNFGTSNDAYSRSRIIAARVEAFIKALGYPARTHVPGTSYDLMVPPIAIDAGLGQQARHSAMITPELGGNFRPAIITTNIPMATDKPIDFGVDEFCAHCKVCAEVCPSGAIPMGEKVEVRGYLKYQLDTAKCHNFWSSNLGDMGCRLCVASCPYTRKANWLHRLALKVTANDPTGISDRALTSLQKSFYPGPPPEDYYIPSMGGKNASYREPPWWLRTEDFIDLG
jgi:epoxyqueuosine reductase